MKNVLSHGRCLDIIVLAVAACPVKGSPDGSLADADPLLILILC